MMGWAQLTSCIVGLRKRIPLLLVDETVECPIGARVHANSSSVDDRTTFTRIALFVEGDAGDPKDERRMGGIEPRRPPHHEPHARERSALSQSQRISDENGVGFGGRRPGRGPRISDWTDRARGE